MRDKKKLVSEFETKPLSHQIIIRWKGLGEEMQNKIDRSRVYHALICAFILFIVTACISPLGRQLPTSSQPAANSTAAGEATQNPAANPAATAAPTVPNAAGKPDAAFPFKISEDILPAEKVTDLTNLANPGNYQMAEDGQGTLHVIWSAIHQLFHRERSASGQWSDASAFPTTDYSSGDQAELLIAPDGSACVLWMDFGMVENNALISKFQVEKYASGQWGPSAELTGQFDPLVPLLTYTTFYQAQFDPQGHLQLYFENVDGGNDPVPAGFYIGKLSIFADEDTSKDENRQFMIDQQGNYHLVFFRNNQIIYRVSKDQGKTWREPALQTGTTLNEEYASLAPDQNAYFHFMLLNGGSPMYVSWISSRMTPEGLPLFNRDEMFKQLMKDPRYQKLIAITPQALTQDGSGRLHFTAQDGNVGFSQVVLEKDGSWSVQKVEQDGFPVMLLVGKNAATYILWRTNEALFVSEQK